MPRFFVPTDNFDNNKVKITGDDARHIARALRMAKGESITVCDMHGYEHTCILDSFTDDTLVMASIVESKKSENEPPYKITLYQAVPKGDKIEYITQKSVELGVFRIVPFVSERCVSRPDEKSANKKVQRLSKIAAEAAKQCGRAVLPEFSSFTSFEGMLSDSKSCQLKLFLYEGDGTIPLNSVLREYRKGNAIPESIAIVIGSEGGFSQKESERAREFGFTLCGLGNRILRTETASGCVLSCIMYEYEI